MLENRRECSHVHVHSVPGWIQTRRRHGCPAPSRSLWAGTRQGGSLSSALRTKVLLKLGLTQSLADPSVYTRFKDGQFLADCLLHRGDFVIMVHAKVVSWFKKSIVKEWEMKDAFSGV